MCQCLGRSQFIFTYFTLRRANHDVPTEFRFSLTSRLRG